MGYCIFYGMKDVIFLAKSTVDIWFIIELSMQIKSFYIDLMFYFKMGLGWSKSCCSVFEIIG